MLQHERTMSKLFAPGDFLLASPRRGLAQRVGSGHAARFEICNRQSSGTQQRCAISSAIALADCTWLLDIGDRRKSANADRRCSERSAMARFILFTYFCEWRMYSASVLI